MPLLRLHDSSLAWPFLAALLALLTLMVALVELNILKYAYERMGIPPRYILAILLLTLLGSSINIPFVAFARAKAVSGHVVHLFGMSYVVPVIHAWPGVILAVNVGGALIPIILSMYLTLKNRLFGTGLIAIAAVALVTHLLSRTVYGVGVTEPIFIPPLIAALVALALSWRRAAPLAYVAGTIGTLIGADLLNLDKLSGMGAPVASIGGAGTFDSVFLVGIAAVLLASLIQPSSPARLRSQ